MAKQTPITNNKKYTKLALVLVAGAVLVYFGIFFAVEQRAKSAEKKEFLQNKAQIEEIAKKIVSVYPPSEEKHVESCSYQSAKFGRGDLYCRVGVELKYKNLTVEKANEIASGSTQSAGLNLRPSQSFQNKVATFVADNEPNSPQGILADITAKPRNCSLSFVYDSGKESTRELLATISCARVAKAEHFPVEK